MKKLTTLLIVLLSALYVNAQVPESFSYQAVLRGSSSQIISDQIVDMQISILRNSTPLYVERFTTNTNQFGIVTLDIGNGTPQSGDFSSIDWSDGTYFIKIELDENGGTDYVELGTSQLLSVPYALHAKTSADAFSGDYDDLTDLPTSQVIDSAYSARLMAADEDYIDFGTFEGFTNNSDWSIIESVKMPAGTGASGGWHFFRGLAWGNKEGDISIQITTGSVNIWLYKNTLLSLASSDTYLEETWYNICLQYDDALETLYLYVDGVLVDQMESVAPQDDSGNTNKLIWGGQDVAPGAHGSLYSEASIVIASQQWFQRLLTQEEIENYQGYIEDESGLFFEAIIGESGVSDGTGNGHDGSNGNSPEFLKSYFEYGTLFEEPVNIENEVTVNDDLTVNGSVLGVQYYEILSSDGPDLEASGLAHEATVDANSYGISAALYIASDGNYEEADADAAATMPCIGLAIEEGTGTKGVLLHGFIRNDAWSFTPGAPVYVSSNAGELTQVIPVGTGQQVQIVGYATASNTLYFNPDFTVIELN